MIEIKAGMKNLVSELAELIEVSKTLKGLHYEPNRKSLHHFMNLMDLKRTLILKIVHIFLVYTKEKTDANYS